MLIILERNETLLIQDIEPKVKLTFLERYTSFFLPIILLVSDYVSVLLAEKTALFLRPFFSFAYNSNFNVPDSYQYIFVPAVFLFF